ncbi:MAG: antibiotic biosynthesis monooxygenase [Thermodesulfobacteriota bacterium]
MMYVRMTFFKLKNGKMEELRNLYNKEVISAHKDHKGIRFVHLLESLDNKDEGVSVTAWDTKADVEAYEKSGDYEKLVVKFKDLYAEDPVLKSYEVTASSEPIILRIF